MKLLRKIIILSTLLLLFGSISPSFSFIPLQQAEAATIKISKTTYQTTTNLNMRSGASTRYKLVITIPKGKVVTATEKYGSWYRVSYTYTSNGKTITKIGWVSGQYLKKVSSTQSKVEAKATSTLRISKTTFQTTTNLNMRSGASTRYKLVITIPKGKVVTATEKYGSWYRVSYTYTSNGKTITKSGWVTSTYLKEYYQYTNISATYYFNSKPINLYQTPDTKRKSVYTLPVNNGLYTTQKVVNSIGQIWNRISFNGNTWYVHTNNLTKHTSRNFTAATYKANKDTYLFQSFGSAYAKIVKIPRGTVISTSSSISAWYKTVYSSKSGYVNIADFSKYTASSTQPAKPDQPNLTETAITGKTYLVKAILNVRAAASEGSAILTIIPQGKIVVPTHKVSNGWYKLVYNGKNGYVSGSFLQEVVTGDPLTSRDDYQFIDLRTKAPVTAAQIDTYIANYVKVNQKTSVLTGKGQAFINAGNKYGVNALYLAAHAIHESGYGTSSISLGKYNLFGFGAYDAAPFIGAYRFSSVEVGIEYIAREMKATYLNPNNWKYKGSYLGFSTKTIDNARIDANSEGMNFYYASDTNWGKGIAAHMGRILAYDKAYYLNVKPNLTVYSSPEKPAGGDVFPSNILAISKGSLELNSQARSNTIAITLKSGTKFTLLEKTNDFWLKINVDGKVYWTNDIKFDRYKEYIAVKNLGRVAADTLNVRSGPSTSYKQISSLNLNQFVQLVLDKEEKLTVDSTGKWYKVKLSNGTEGWVSSQYIVQELK